MILGFDIRPGDRKVLLPAFLLLANITAGHAILETARDILFLTRLSPRVLPWAYMGIAVLSVGIALLARAPRLRVDRRLRLMVMLAVAGLATASFWVWADRSSRVLPLVLYMWTGIVATTLLPRFWLLLHAVVAPAQAKRLYPLIGAAALVGAFAGSLAAGVLVHIISVRSLLLVSAIVLVAAIPLVLLIVAAPAAAADGRAGHKSARGPRKRPLGFRAYLVHILVLTLAMAATAAVLDFVFKSAVSARVDSRHLSQFFGITYAAVNGVALVMQFAVAPFLLRRFGAVYALVVLPLLLTGGAVGFLLSGSLAPILAAKVADGALRNSLARVGSELLLLPLPPAERERMKPFTDALGWRGGQGLGSLLIVGLLALGGGTALVAASMPVLAGVWVVAALRLRPLYLGLVRASMTADRMRGRPRVAGDLEAVETLVTGLSSTEDAEVIAAMEILSESGKIRLVPTTMIFHPGKAVMRRALQLLSADPKRPDLPRAVARLSADPDPRVRAVCLAVAAAVAGDAGERLEASLSDHSQVVRAAAVAALLGRDRQHQRAWTEAERVATEGSPEERSELARAIADLGDPALLLRFVDAAGAEEPALLSELARAVQAAPSVELMPRLIAMLAHRDARAQAQQAIKAVGPPALSALAEALSNASTPLGVRRHLPGTIQLVGTAEAAAILTKQLAVEQDGSTRFKIVRALGRMRAVDPDLALDEAPLHSYARSSADRILELIAWRLALPEGAERELLVTLLREKERHSLERLFRILGLLYPREEIHAVYRSLRRGDQRRRDAAAEVLAQVLDRDLRATVQLLVDELEDLERLRRAGRPVVEHADALAAMAADHSFALPVVVAYLHRKEPQAAAPLLERGAKAGE